MPSTDLLLELTERYTEPHRRFHDLSHIAQLLLRGRALQLDAEQVMAIWFHDAIYEPGAHNNEELSAALAVERLTAAGWADGAIKKVERIVLDTARHRPSIDASRNVMDLDLSTLAGSWQDYWGLCVRLREEYGSMSDDQWTHGRRGFIQSMLDRDRIFCTRWAEPLEAQARANLQRELRVLDEADA